MKILAVNWRCIKNPEMGGAEVHFHEIFKRVVKLGHDVTLVVHQFSGGAKEEIVDGIKIIRIGNKYNFKLVFKKYYKKFLSDRNFDLVVDDISKIPMGTPKFVNSPVIAVLHHIHGKTLFKEIPAIAAYYISRCEKNIPKYYSGSYIFTVSPSTKRELIQLGQPEDKTDILYNAINHELFNSVDIEKSETPLITYVGRIKKYKQVELIINALPELIKKFPDIEFHVGGTGDNIEELKKHAHRLGVAGSVRFLGFLSEQEKAELLGRAWVFVTMAMKEGWGITVIEANAMGTPVIGSNVPGLQDSICNAETGYLVNFDEPEKLVAKISELLENRELRTEFSANAKRWAQKFTWDESANYFIRKVKEWYPKLK